MPRASLRQASQTVLGLSLFLLVVILELNLRPLRLLLGHFMRTQAGLMLVTARREGV
jgi:hypothetical protein